jgi:hypothetical protein
MDSSSFIAITVGLVVFLIIFLALREVMLWYWKVNDIISGLESIKQQVKLQSENHRKQLRIDFYKAKVLGDKQAAYESLLQIVIDDLLKDNLKHEQRQQRYTELQKKQSENFERLGYRFPEYSILFD